MTDLTSMGLTQTGLWCFGLTVASAIFPWLSAELIVLSLPAVATTRTALFILVVLATAGQMTGKCVVYWIGRKGNRALPGRPGQALRRWRERLERQPSKAAALVLVSSIVGLPPFYIMTLLAGAMKMNFPLFLTVGTAGRLLRFGVLVLLPQLAIRLFQGGT